jgi:hypothetical protein
MYSGVRRLLFKHLLVGSIQNFIETLIVPPFGSTDAKAQPEMFEVASFVP